MSDRQEGKVIFTSVPVLNQAESDFLAKYFVADILKTFFEDDDDYKDLDFSKIVEASVIGYATKDIRPGDAHK
ncbi:hypothetical protein [Oenococcus sp.]|uniref:hypothetical protein n=1 Tax=Oenococcus sp. TaxID=1979414 RepID=UPI0039EA9E56